MANTESPKQSPDTATSVEADGFVVTEAHHEEQALVGEDKPSGKEELGIETTADLVEKEARTSQSGTPEPADQEDDLQLTDNSSYEHVPDETEQDSFAGSPVEPDKSSGPERNAGRDEDSAEYLSLNEKMELVQKLSRAAASEADKNGSESEPGQGKGFDSLPIEPPRDGKKGKNKKHLAAVARTMKEQEAPQMARRSRGIAYFYKNFVQIKGEQQLHEDEELTVGDRFYTLKPKRLSKQVLIGALVPVAAALVLFISAQLGAGPDSGTGSVVGFALDEYQQPLLTGAQVRFPELGKTYRTNSQGFFTTDLIDPGTQKIEYLLDGEVVYTDYVTVVGGKVTTVSLKPSYEYSEEATNEAPNDQSPEPVQISQAPQKQAAPEPAQPAKKSTKKNSSSSKKKSSSQKSSQSGPKYAKLSLSTNVPNAKLSIDGKILGVGDLTYTELKPGDHEYAISMDGYQQATGKIKLTAGKTASLEVQLEPATIAQKADTYDASDYFYSGVNNAELEKYDEAIADFTRAIEAKPSYVDAYVERANAYQIMYDKRAARDDFIRAAEIYRFKGDQNQAISCYNQALELDPKCVTAYLGRGDLYLARGEEIAAIADYDMVVGLDKRNLQGHLGLGKARYNQGYYKKATKHFKDARSIDSDNPVAYKHLMLCYMNQGDVKKVNKSYEKFLECASAEEIERVRNSSEFSAALRMIKE